MKQDTSQAAYTRAIKNMAADDRPREKALQHGFGALSTAELLAILVGSGTRGESVVDLCQRILNTFDNRLNSIARLSVKDLTKQFRGIGSVRAITILAALELGRRYHSEKMPQRPQVLSSRSVYDYLKMDLIHLPHEEFWMLTLDRAKHITAKIKISSGGTSMTAVDPKIILKTAIDHLAEGIIIAHNHPSGNNFPSPNDDNITIQLQKSCHVIGIEFVDHVIISETGYYSYVDEGKI